MEIAKQEGRKLAEQLARAQTSVSTLGERDRLIYQRASEHLAGTKTALDIAAYKYAEATRLLGDVDLLEAVRFYRSQQHTVVKHKQVTEVVEEMIQLKEQKGRSLLYIKDLKLRLGRFARAFRGYIDGITPTDIERFLQSLKVAPRTKNNFLRNIGTLFQFAKARGYIQEDHSGTSRVEKETEIAHEVEVFSPSEMAALLAHAKPEVIPFLVLGGFAGLRSEEIRRLDWEDIKLEAGHIEIKARIAKTKTRRLVPISENLRRWLTPHHQSSGRVINFKNYVNQLVPLTKCCGVTWRRNGLRHSWISYRVALEKDVHRVAIEAGNSANIITKHYLKCVTEVEANRWFTLMPQEKANVLAVPFQSTSPVIEPTVAL